jgi:hypothetical protein
MFAGERYSERVASQEENYTEMKENIRNARKKKDGKGSNVPPPPAPKRFVFITYAILAEFMCFTWEM